MVITLDDVVGLEHQKQIMHDSLILPLQKKELYTSLILSPDKIKERKNFLFYGPPGTGKTHLAHAIAHTCGLSVTMVESTQLLQRYVGDGPKALRELYDTESGLIFIDEIDAIALARSDKQLASQDVLLQLLLLLDSVQSSYSHATILATNRMAALDPALLSRIPLFYQLHFPAPDAMQRKRIIDLQLSYHQTNKIDSSYLVSLTEGYDGRQLEDLFLRARQIALKNDRNYLSSSDFSLGVKND